MDRSVVPHALYDSVVVVRNRLVIIHRLTSFQSHSSLEKCRRPKEKRETPRISLTSSGVLRGETRWGDEARLMAVAAPLTPRPRGTIYEALPFILHRVLDRRYRQRWDRAVDMILPVEGQRNIHDERVYKRHCTPSRSAI